MVGQAGYGVPSHGYGAYQLISWPVYHRDIVHSLKTRVQTHKFRLRISDSLCCFRFNDLSRDHVPGISPGFGNFFQLDVISLNCRTPHILPAARYHRWLHVNTLKVKASNGIAAQRAGSVIQSPLFYMKAAELLLPPLRPRFVEGLGDISYPGLQYSFMACS